METIIIFIIGCFTIAAVFWGNLAHSVKRMTIRYTPNYNVVMLDYIKSVSELVITYAKFLNVLEERIEAYTNLMDELGAEEHSLAVSELETLKKEYGVHYKMYRYILDERLSVRTIK